MRYTLCVLSFYGMATFLNTSSIRDKGIDKGKTEELFVFAGTVSCAQLQQESVSGSCLRRY